MPIRRSAFVAGLIAVLVTTSCSASSDSGDDGAVIVAVTTDIWTDVARNVMCVDDVEFVTIIASGADLHSVEPSLADRATMGAADLVIVNGLDLEEGFAGTIEVVADEGGNVLELAHDDETTDDEAPDDEAHDDEGHDHTGRNPHIWLDPDDVSEAVDEIAAAAVEIGLDETAVTRCAEEYKAELASLSAELDSAVDTLDASRRLLVTDHDVLQPFADRFGFEVVGTVTGSNSTLAAANPADLADLAATIVDREIPAVFAEVDSSTGDLDALAAAADGVEVVEVRTASLAPNGSPGDTYLNLMRELTRVLVTALGK